MEILESFSWEEVVCDVQWLQRQIFLLLEQAVEGEVSVSSNSHWRE